ncbi:G1/S-specific cyclin-D2-like [Tribolium madens]|uniref:G1/S-specific cyclin-D2-like n=1 Tax=Tribolium madens TaxID=41895 RepID=UPI001CF74661|nr:G1/S-specific cyclin-D2-like [Tribolium madens]
MMDLHCCETTENEIRAFADDTLLQDRVLKNMLQTEYRCVPSNVFIIQREITESMIEIVGGWMMEVCEEQTCQDDVFLLSMNYLYRFLTTTNIKKNQLQLLGAACMLVASKLREPKPLSAEMLVFYTDHSITTNMLTSWERLVLSKLKWDIIAIMPVDFLPHLLIRLDLERLGIKTEMVKKHAKILITLCAKECRFTNCYPSLLACASVVSALCGLGWVNKYHQSQEALFKTLADIIEVPETDFMQELVQNIDQMIKQNFENVKDNKVCDEVTRSEQCTPPPGKIRDYKTATTPTDVHDVCF